MTTGEKNPTKNFFFFYRGIPKKSLRQIREKMALHGRVKVVHNYLRKNSCWSSMMFATVSDFVRYIIFLELQPWNPFTTAKNQSYIRCIAFHGVQIFNSVHLKKKKFVTLLLCLKGSSSGNWESWNFLDTFNHSRNILKRKNIFLQCAHFFGLYFEKCYYFFEQV